MAGLDRPREPSEGDAHRRTSDEAMSRLGILNGAARAHQMPTKVTTADRGENYYVHLDRRTHTPIRVFCGTRTGDSGRLWFYGDGGEWIAEASEAAGITAALTWLKAKHAGDQNAAAGMAEQD